MNISVKSEYALQAVFDLALQPPGEPVKIADVARRQKIPQKFLELILASLKQGGFVESRRGAEGGIGWLSPPMRSSSAKFCGYWRTASRRSATPRPFQPIWKRVDDAVAAILDHTTFAELARSWKQSQTRYVANWDI